MDIYAVEKQAGCYLANELEKLRKRRCNSRVAVKCSPMPANNDKINRIRNSFLLDRGLTNVFADADQYLMIICSRAVAFLLCYDVCQILYRLREETDWKFVELEILNIKHCQSITPNKPVLAGRAEATAFEILARLAVTHGFQKTFHPLSDTFLYDIFDKISTADTLQKADFGLESKITALIYRLTIR